MPRFTPDWEPDDLESDEFDVPEFRGVPSALTDNEVEAAGARTATASRASGRPAARPANGRGNAARTRSPIFPDDELLDEDLLAIAELDAWPEPEERRAKKPTARAPRRVLNGRDASGGREAGGRPASPKTAAGRAAGGRSNSRTNSRSKSARASGKNAAPRTTPPRALNFEVVGVLCLAIGAVLFYNAVRPQADGFITRVIIAALRGTFGVGAVVMPMLMCALGALLIVRRHQTNLRAFWRGILVGLLVFLTAVHLTVPVGYEFSGPNTLYNHGGVIGAALTWLLRRAVGEIGAIIVLIAFSLVALLFLTEVSLSSIVGRIGGFVHRGAVNVRDKTGDAFRRGFTLEDFTQNEAGEYDELDGELEPVARAGSRKSRVLPEEILNDERLKSGRDKVVRRNSPFFKIDEREIEEEAAALAREVVPPKKSVPATAKAALPAVEEAAPRIEIIDTPPPPSVVDGSLDNADAPELDEVVTVHHQPIENATGADGEPLTPTEALEAQALASAGQGAPRPQRPQRVRRHFGDGPLMPEYFDDAVRSLDPPLMPDVAGVEDDIKQGVQSVQETLAAFKIDARVTDVKRGPVITRYEVQPAPGVRVATIANLDRDMARSLSAIAVRIEAPVPGKNVVGIEVPNKRVHLVRLRDVLELPEFLSAQSKLAFVLGKDIAGQPKWADLTKMPHMLVAGATNSGKSVCLNAIISSIITRAAPDEVKFSLIDPKRVELTLYRGIPHLYHPVVVEPKDAVKVLRGMILEMDRRYKMFAQRGVRNIVSYNGKLEEDEAPLPYIVIVIDELADLMMTAAAEFEKLICRLAQLARATGIHLIVATQRPSVNVITGVIKANIPARVAFAVASQVDSRTILDAVGAERLIGSGDMLFDANNGGKATRIQGAYLSEEEVNRIVEVVKNNYADEPLEYGLDLDAMDDEDEVADTKSGYASEDKRDDLYDEIKEFVLRHQEMSASMIQRKFEIGFPRAGRIVDQLERNGVLGPADGPKARKVIGPGRE